MSANSITAIEHARMIWGPKIRAAKTFTQRMLRKRDCMCRKLEKADRETRVAGFIETAIREEQNLIGNFQDMCDQNLQGELG